MLSFPPNPPNLPPAAFCTRSPPADQRRLGRIAAFTVLAIIGGMLAVTLITVLLTHR